jgi:hypothetical protein
MKKGSCPPGKPEVLDGSLRAASDALSLANRTVQKQALVELHQDFAAGLKRLFFDRLRGQQALNVLGSEKAKELFQRRRPLLQADVPPEEGDQVLHGLPILGDHIAIPVDLLHGG